MLSQESLAKIDRELTKYPADRRQAAVMSALRIAQDEKGWLSKDTVAFVAEYLGIPPIAALEVASFYNMYELEPVGQYKITVCTNISCMLRDSDVIVDHLQERLGIGFNETTPDGKFTLKEGECMGCCGGAPLFHINNKRMCEFLTKEKVDAILEELK
ncbi:MULTISPECIES: NADH-quinone oxidoreductase subunit NuoE [Methylovorus]|jgi:NADH-quinone oxidoreductase subunit E|uniref:NADH-quinone oxidoreductase, E subunit n=1 Tax=Methylovorus glucosotrophus (strain SIP3-4) TaxID=582744 RepID=C6XAJ1_METGS|nr:MULTISPECIES: NADH-quinone oxidoreductase subunit NuoE [Methylovorus]ACT49923.1 NADH-quinone oxidoreductase, E subunit [Methylovorus glucosotrophus SIP3-4]ADQ83885.1 NADH-quinone oxidoreductase, E subunit [Methylovorus sp. MP688]KAF0844734.1 NADH dehydrogenase subunit E [Methylovorus glucosotrophus]